MQGQAHNIDDFGAPNWQAKSTGDDLIMQFWKWKHSATARDGPEYFRRWDGSSIDADAARGPPGLAEHLLPAKPPAGSVLRESIDPESQHRAGTT